jgi:DNA repair exonuclease SbcCD nuclease subunit
MALKIVHAADLHVDSPLRGLERYEGAPVDLMRRATRRALENLITFCIAEHVELLLLAGDLFDDDWKDYGSGLFFVSQLARLAESNTRVVWIRGNHDAASKITRRLKLPGPVHELGVRRPDSIVFEDLGVCVHGQGFATAAVTDNLAERYPQPISGLFNVGLLHTALEGREGHGRYAPCRLDTLVNKGYDYWALGHVHKREVLSQDPWVAFPGNLQGRHAKETGAKGALLLNVEGVRVAAVHPVAVDVVRWEICEVDASAAASADDVVDLAGSMLEQCLEQAEGRLIAARIVIRGATRAHLPLRGDPERWIGEIRARGIELCGSGLWIEQVRLETRTELDFERLRSRDDPAGHLARALHDLRADVPRLGELLGNFAELRQKLPNELRTAPLGLALDDPEVLRAALDDVEQILLPRLLSLEER